MIKPAYYNEIDEYAAQWLRNLIAAGHIAPGDVDTRSIEDVKPDDLRPYTQCHFFAGIGVWSLALRRAGWPDDRAIWSMSCPCQPFSQAGEGAAFADERHLWPAAYHLITQRRPPVVTGEQVASKDANPWIDLVQADMEALGYPFGAVAFPSAGVGAPHIRDRTYWVAHAGRSRLAQRERVAGISCGAVGADAGQAFKRNSFHDAGGLADPLCSGPFSGAHLGVHRGEESSGSRDGESKRPSSARGERPGPTNGLWRDADWLACRDGKWRPVEPSTFPLAHGAAARMGRLRAYGNAINSKAAEVFIRSFLDATNG